MDGHRKIDALNGDVVLRSSTFWSHLIIGEPEPKIETACVEILTGLHLTATRRCLAYLARLRVDVKLEALE